MLSPSVAPHAHPPGSHHPPPRGAGQRIRVTNRTRLRIYYGSLDADAVVLDEDGSGNGFATAGVDAEDAKEHHLQVVLSLQSLEGGWTEIQHHEEENADASKKEPERKAHIPVPDATGVVDNYKELYTAADPWKDSTEYLRYSDNIDEALDGGLRDGYVYDIDEDDEAWMQRHENDPEGLGNLATDGRLSRAKSRSKELGFPAIGIQKPEYELTMGVMEMICDSHRPTLHTNLATIPAMLDFEETFVHDLEEDYFASFDLPPTVPKPERLWSLARTLYPFWRERKIVRGGHRIMPQLNTDETIEDDHFVCFRRRDPKAIRRTRRSDNTHIDRFARMRMNFEELDDIARSTLLREQKKAEQIHVEHDVYQARKRFSHVARRPDVNQHPEDERLLLPTHMEPRLFIQLSTKKWQRLEERVHSSAHLQRLAEIREMVQERTEQEYRKRKLADEDYENQIDVPAQPKTKTAGSFTYHFIQHEINPAYEPLPPPTTNAGHGSLVGLRVRRGRGGMLRLDRTLSRRVHPPTAVDLFTKKPLVFESDPETPDETIGEQMTVEPSPAVPNEEEALSDVSLKGITESDANRDYFRKWYFGGHPSAAPDLDDQGMLVVDEFAFPLLHHRASLHNPGKPNPLHADPAYLLSAQAYVRDARAKETKEPVCPPPASAVAPVRISGLKLMIPPQQPGGGVGPLAANAAMVSHFGGRSQPQGLADQYATANHIPPGGSTPSFRPAPSHASPELSIGTESHRPPLSHQAPPTPQRLPADRPPPSISPELGRPHKPQAISPQVATPYPLPSAARAPAQNELGLQLGPTSLKLSSAVPSPSPMMPSPGHHFPAYHGPFSGPGVRRDSPARSPMPWAPPPGMPVNLHQPVSTINYASVPSHHPAMLAASYAHAMNIGGYMPPSMPSGPQYAAHPDYGHYGQQWHQAYNHTFHPSHLQAGPPSSYAGSQPTNGDMSQHFVHGQPPGPPELQNFSKAVPNGHLNLRLSHTRQRSSHGQAVPPAQHAMTPERNSTPAQIPHPPNYPTPLTRPPSEPRELPSSPSRLRTSSSLSSDNGASSPVNPSPLPTTPVSQPAVSQDKSPVE